MTDFFSKLREQLEKIKSLVRNEEFLNLKKWLIDIPLQNEKIIATRNKIEKDKLEKGFSHIKDLEKEPAKRGEVFHVDFGYGIGAEYRYNHYCVVLAVEGKIVIVVPLTSSNSKYNQNSDFVVSLGEILKMPGQVKDSYALINQIRSISRYRLRRPRKERKKLYPKLDKDQLNLLDNCIKNQLTKL